MHKIIGIDIGGTKSSIVLGEGKENKDINIVGKKSFLTETDKGPYYTIDKIYDNVDGLLAENGVDMADISAFGISCGGPLDSKKGIIMSPPNLIGWDEVPITRLLEERYGKRTKLQNDANACALAEWLFGAGKGRKNIIFLTFGTGLGAGIILGGRLYIGTNDMAGEVGHIRLDANGPVGYGKAGSFEGFCSGGGIAQLARIKVLEKLQLGEKVSFCEGPHKLSELSAKAVAEAAMAGDQLAIEIYRICGHYLGMGLSILIDILNPEIIIIGSIFARSRGLLWEAAEEVINKETLKASREVCRVVPSELGDKIGDYAALAVALYQ